MPSAEENTIRPTGNNQIIAALAPVFLICGAVVLCIHWNRVPQLVYSDAEGYFKSAVNLKNHGVFSESEGETLYPISFRTPGYPFFLSILFRIFGENPRVAAAANLFLVVATGVLAFVLARALKTSRLRSATAAVLVGLNPLALHYMLFVTTDTLFAFLCVAALCCMTQTIAADQRRRGILLVCSILLGIMPLVRPVGLYVSLAAAAIMTVTVARRTEQSARTRALTLAIMFTLAFGPTLGWMARNKKVFGDFYFCEIGAWGLRHYHGNLVLSKAEGQDYQQALDQAHETYFHQYYEPKSSPKELRDIWMRESLDIFAPLLRTSFLSCARRRKNTGRRLASSFAASTALDARFSKETLPAD